MRRDTVIRQESSIRLSDWRRDTAQMWIRPKRLLCFTMLCKNLDIEEMNMLVEQYQIGDYYIDKPQLAHSKLAAAILKDKFGVEDEDILNAVRYHTTGRAGMSLLEKIIFVADATEPNRTYEEAEELNKLAFSDLDQACTRS